MNNLVIVFTLYDDFTAEGYFDNIYGNGVIKDSFKICGLSFKGKIIDKGDPKKSKLPENPKIIFINDKDRNGKKIDNSIENELKKKVNKKNEIYVVYHKSSKNHKDNRECIKRITSGKELYTTEEHHNSGAAFKALEEKIGDAIKEKDKAKYDKGINDLLNKPDYNDPFLEARIAQERKAANSSRMAEENKKSKKTNEKKVKNKKGEQNKNIKKLIIWDEWDKKEHDFIEGFKHEGDDVVYSEDKLIKKLKNSPAYDAIIILVELGWKGHDLQEFFGITIAQELRSKYEVKCPIIFITSLLPKKIVEKDKKKGKAIGAKGYDIIQFSEFFKENVDKRIKELKVLLKDDKDKAPIWYSDNRFHHCDVRGAASSEFHNLKNKVREKQKNQEDIDQEDIDDIIGFINTELDKLKDIVSEYSKAVQWLESQKIKCEGNEEEKKEEIDNFKQNPEDEFRKHIAVEDDEEYQFETTEKKPWEILWLEDEVIEQDIEEKLDNKGIKKKQNQIHIAKTVEEAKQIIEADKWNKITVVIIDFRLYDLSPEIIKKYGEKVKEQDEQGYDFLLWLTEQNRFNKLVVRSGLSRIFLREVFRKKGIDVKIYSKNDTTKEGLNIFVNDIEEYGDEMFNVIHSLPSGTAWKEKYLKKYYVYHRCYSKTYETDEEEINNKAKDIVKQVMFILEAKNKELQILNKVSTLKDIGADLDKENIRSDSDDFNVFKKKLIARRVGWYLHYRFCMERNGIYTVLMHGDVIAVNKDMRQLTGSVGEFLSKIAFLIEDFPHKILVEEKLWLKNMGMDTENLGAIFSHCEYYVQSVINKFIRNKENLISSIPEKYRVGNKIIITHKQAAITVLRILIEEIAPSKQSELAEETKKEQSELAKEIKNLLDLIKGNEYCSMFLDNIKQLLSNLISPSK